MGYNSVPAMDDKKDQVAFDCGKVDMKLLQKGIRPREFLTRDAFEKRHRTVAATGGIGPRSASSAGHSRAIAGVGFGDRRFQTVSERTPLLADLKPSGRFVAPICIALAACLS